MAEAHLLEFADKMGEIMPVLMKEFARHQTSEFYKTQITFSQFFILNFLNQSGETKMKDLAGFMKVTTPAMTGIIERLVRQGYLKRLYDTLDRRIIRVDLTVKGKGLLLKIKEQRRKIDLKVFARLSEEDRQDYLRIMQQILESLAQENVLH